VRSCDLLVRLNPNLAYSALLELSEAIGRQNTGPITPLSWARTQENRLRFLALWQLNSPDLSTIAFEIFRFVWIYGDILPRRNRSTEVKNRTLFATCCGRWNQKQSTWIRLRLWIRAPSSPPANLQSKHKGNNLGHRKITYDDYINTSSSTIKTTMTFSSSTSTTQSTRPNAPNTLCRQRPMSLVIPGNWIWRSWKGFTAIMGISDRDLTLNFSVSCFGTRLSRPRLSGVGDKNAPTHPSYIVGNDSTQAICNGRSTDIDRRWLYLDHQRRRFVFDLHRKALCSAEYGASSRYSTCVSANDLRT